MLNLKKCNNNLFMNKRGEIFRPFFVFIRMKYIIPQDKVDKVIFKYLDLNLKGVEKKNPKYFEGFVFTFPDEDYGVLGWEKPDILYIYYKLIEDISNTFGLNESDSKSVIVRWVEDRLKLEVVHTWGAGYRTPEWVEDRLN